MMSAMDRSELLSQISLFRGLSPEDRHALGEKLIERTYAPGERIFAQGESGTSMFVVVSGSVQVFLPPPATGAPRVVLKEMAGGEHFGELALFDDKPRSASAEAVAPTNLFELSRDDFIAGLVKSPPAVLSVLSEMANRLRDTNQLLSQRAAKDAVKEMESRLTWSERLADRVAEINGSWRFILFLCAVTGLWALVNAFVIRPFDAYPYVFFNLVLALLVALQGPLIVMSQNRQAEKERAQAASDFQVNLKNEMNIETLVRQVAEFRRETNQRLERLEGDKQLPQLKVTA
jgi:uncharacterized membrane protein